MASYQERALSRSARLLALLQALRCRRRPVTAAALARELQVSERTIYRDLSELAAQGRQSRAKPALAMCSVQAVSCPRSCSPRTKRKPSCLGYDMLTSVATTSSLNALAKILAVLPQEGQIVATLPIIIPGPKADGFPE